MSNLISLKNHPFAVDAYFKYSAVITYAAPIEQLVPLIPKHLTIDSYENRWGFIAIAMVQTQNLKPASLLNLFGRDFFLIGYRIFVNYKTSQGKRLRGLYILKSETDNPFMTLSGNIFTHYHYKTTDISSTKTSDNLQIKSEKSQFDVKLNWKEPTLPDSSPFPDWKTARRFAGPLPFTFTYQEKQNTMLIIEGKRQNWTPQPASIDHANIQWLDTLPVDGLIPANAFIIENIPYQWQKGKIDHIY